ncbi:SDR family oxidoreductase [Staphylococcus caeli]|uniref:SDR family oxidoreductase n=1 Tax=Staphylococcus caeli TaxID=2201815 RepID=UPI003F575A9A
MNILVIGANGNTGKKVIQKLNETEHTSVAMVRREEQINELKALGADKIVLGDLEKDFSHAFKRIDGVIFAAGSGGATGADKTMLVDLWGAKKAVDYAEQSKVKRFIHLTATDSLDPDSETENMKPYAVAKNLSDYYIKNSTLAYTLIHPGPLNNDIGTGKIDATVELNNHPNSYTIAREDVATTLVQALDINSLQRASIFIQSGDHDIKDALNQVQ